MPHTPLTPEIVAALVDRMATNFRAKTNDAQVEVWFEHISGVDAEVAGLAVDAVIEHEQFFPTIAAFKTHVADILRARKREEIAAGWQGPNPNCGFCGGNEWYQVAPLRKAVNQPIVEADGRGFKITGHEVVEVDFEQWRPCEPCNPVGMEMWEKWKADMARKRRQSGVDPQVAHHFAGVAKDALDHMAGEEL